jgi:coenzyme Q-binding protein COQ10
MPEFSTKRRVRHSAADMFDLVADVKQYPEFVPLCSALTIKSRSEKNDGTVVLVADMTVAYKIVRETFTSRVTLDRTHLNPTGDSACDVEFFIEYEFKSRTLALLMGAMFDAAFRRFAVAFEKRADAVYGRKMA